MVNNSLVERLSELSFKHGVDELNPNCEVCAEIISIKKQIEEIIEKAEKHDELINGRYGILELNEKITTQEQQIKQLKEELAIKTTESIAWQNRAINFKKVIDEIREICDNINFDSIIEYIMKETPMLKEYNDMPIVCHKFTKLKSILSKIEKVK